MFEKKQVHIDVNLLNVELNYIGISVWEDIVWGDEWVRVGEGDGNCSF